ncbi:MAG TPA: TRAP transporter substrate-binding protein [Candidatus Elarobacter sp.]|jgi:tripartite ATP-independent transporter DctP family solute receptor|nr:TRAP transporter substrate-binding protein [Candidatus Elarobacter sp.]
MKQPEQSAGPTLHPSRGRFVAGGAAVFATIAVVRAKGRAADFELKCGTQLPADDKASLRLTEMWAAIERESGGRVKTQFFPASALGSEVAMFSQLRLGALDFQHLTAGTLAALVPVANIAYLGFAYKDSEEGIRLFEGPLGQYVAKETASKGLYMFHSMWKVGMGEVGTNGRPVAKADDLRGLKIRVSANKISVDLFSELGASATPLNFADVYPGLQTKLVDGVSSSLAIIESSKWYEVLKFASMTNHQWYNQMLIANGETWRKLPPDLQKIVDRNNTKYALLERKDMDAYNAAATKNLQARGITIGPVDRASFTRRLQSYYKAWAAEFGPTAWRLLEAGLGHKLG